MNTMKRMILLCCGWLALSGFAETVAEVQAAMDSSIRLKTAKKNARLKTSSGELERSRTYVGYGELNIIKGDGTIQVSFDVNDYLTKIESAKIYLDAYDVDHPCADERDMVYFNGVEIGRLTGGNNSWALNSFDVSPSSIKTNAVNTLSIAVDVDNGGWVTGVDNVSLVLFGKRGNRISDVTSPYCSGSYNNGRKGTFLTGVDCEIEFEVTCDRIVRYIDHFLVNGERQSNYGSSNYGTLYHTKLTYNVGKLKPGDKMEVVAVDTDGNESEPFRVNLDIADLPGHWTDETIIIVDRQSNLTRVVYRSADLDTTSCFSGITLGDTTQIFGQELPVSFMPVFQLEWFFESDTAQFRCSADIGEKNSAAPSYKNDPYELFVKRRKVGRILGGDIMLGVTGGETYSWEPLTLEYVKSSSEFGLMFDGKLECEFRIPQTGNIAYFKVGVEVGGRVVARRYELNGENSYWVYVADLDPLVALRGTLGLGFSGCVGPEGYLQAGVLLYIESPIEAHGNPVVKKWGFEGKAGWNFALGPLQYHGEQPWHHWWIGGPQGNSKGTRLLASSPLDITSGDWSLIPRDYAKTRTSAESGKKRLLAATGGSASLGDGYPYPSPSLAANGASDVLLYLRDNATRSDINRTELVCCMGTSNEWSSAETVWDDGTADFMPSVAVCTNGTVFAAWVNTKGTLSGDATIEEVCCNMEIAVAVRDAATGTWTSKNLMTDTALDMAPMMKTAADGSAVVAWVRNPSGEFIGSAAKPSSIMLATYRNGSWSSPVSVATDVGMIYSFDVAYDGTTASVVYAKDGDGDYETAEDREVWGVAIANGTVGSVSRLSSDCVDAVRPFAWYDSKGSLCMLWLEGDDLVSRTQFGTRRTVASDCDIPPDYSLIPRADGGAMLVWKRLADTEAGTETVCATYDSVLGCVGEPYVLFHSGTVQERGITGMVGLDGALRMAYESVSVTTNAEGIAEFGAVELKTFRRECGIDVGFGPGAFSFEGDLTIGETTNVLVKVTNYGTETANDATIRVWLGDANRTLLGTTVTNVLPLSTVTVSVPWLVAQGFEDVVFMAEVKGNAFADRDETNNTAAWRPQFAESASLHNVQCVRDGDVSCYIGVTVRNNGLAPIAEGTEVRFWRGELGGELLAVTNLNAILSGVGNEQEAGFTWNFADMPMTSAVERVVVELVSGEFHPTVSVDVEATLYKVTFEDSQGESLGIEPLYVPYGCAIGELPPIESAYVWLYNGEPITPDYQVYGNMTLISTAVFSYKVNGGAVEITKVNNTFSGKFVIPSSVGGLPVTSIGTRAFAGCGGLTSVTIPSSVTYIGDYAFDSCYNLSLVVLPISLRGSISRDNQFRYCANNLQIVFGGFAFVGDDVEFADYQIGQPFGQLPTPTSKDGLPFLGWFSKDGVQVTPETTVTEDNTQLFARWDYSSTKEWKIQNEGGTYMVVDLSGGPDAANYPVSYLDDVPEGGWTDEYKTTKLVLRRIPAGEGRDGSTSYTITKDYYLGVFELTQKQWQLVMGNHGLISSGWYEGDDYAQYAVSYEDMRGADVKMKWPLSTKIPDDCFLGRLRAKTGIAQFDLPTRCQWHRACTFGMNEYPSDEDEELSWQDGKIHPVGAKLPTVSGFYDMRGNVSEWALDWERFLSNDKDGIDCVGGTFDISDWPYWISSRHVPWVKTAAFAAYDMFDYSLGGFTDTHAYYKRGARLCLTTGGHVICDAPVIEPSSGPKAFPLAVTLTNPNMSGTAMYYTVDGSEPSVTNGVLYTGPFELSAPATVKAFAHGTSDTLKSRDSLVSSSTYYGSIAEALDADFGAWSTGEDTAWMPDGAGGMYSMGITNGQTSAISVRLDGKGALEFDVELTPGFFLTSTNTLRMTVRDDSGGLVSDSVLLNVYKTKAHVRLEPEELGGIGQTIVRLIHTGNATRYHETEYCYFDSVRLSNVTWTPVYSYTVEFNPNGGTVGDGVRSVPCDGNIGELPVPSRSGYMFLGWYTEPENGEKIHVSTIISRNMTCYAHWLPNSSIFIDVDESYVADSDGTCSFTLSNLVYSGSTPKLTVKGLPAGLKYDSKTMTISGKATKPGTYKVTVSATNATVKKPVTKTFEIVVPNLKSEVLTNLEQDRDAYGIVTCGVAFDTELVDCSPEEGWTVKVAGLPTGLKFTAKPVTSKVGTGKTAVVVTNVPANTIYGVPTKAGTYTVTFTATKGKEKQVATITLNVEALPTWATGTFTGYVSYPSGLAATSPVSGEELNARAARSTGEESGTRDACSCHGFATMTVAANGKVSGKIALGGTNWTFSATSFSRVEGSSSSKVGGQKSFIVEATAKAGKATMPVVLEIAANALAARSTSSTGASSTGGSPVQDDALANAAAKGTFGEDNMTMWRNVWKDKETAATAKAEIAEFIGVYTVSLEVEDGGRGATALPGYGYLSLTVGKDGNVKATGKLADGTSVSATSPLMYDEDAGWFVVLHAAPSAYKGGAFAAAVGFEADDTAVAGRPPYRLAPVMFMPQWMSRNSQATSEYGAGFDREIDLVGAGYDKGKKLNDYYKTLTFNATAPTLNGNPPTNEDAVDVTFDGKGKPVIQKSSGLSLSFTQATGIFKGGYTFFFDAKTKKKVSFEGIMVQGGVSLRGFYLWDAASEYEDAKTGKIKAYKYKESYPVTLQAQ